MLVRWYIVCDKATFSQKHPRRGCVGEDMTSNGLQRSTSDECHCRTRVSYVRLDSGQIQRSAPYIVLGL